MPRADLLLELVRAASRGDQPVVRKTVEAIVAEERAKQHNVLADRLVAQLQNNGSPTPNGPSRAASGSSDALYESVGRRELADLLLPDRVEAACRELIEEQQRADLLRAHNLEPRHRVLLAGPPGNGKTSVAEAVSTELSVPLLSVRYESVITSYLGETALRLTRLFDHVRSRRCVLFFDEFDVVGKERGDTHETGEIKRLVSSLLLQIDALPSYVVVITATNHPELLDRAVWRRFQLRLSLPAPTRARAEEWLRRFETRLGASLGQSPSSVAQALGPISFAELEEFGGDVQRRYVLSQPSGDLHRVVAACLEQWRTRFRLNRGKPEAPQSEDA
jgi:predicted AAA+ superfamily ATPase